MSLNLNDIMIMYQENFRELVKKELELHSYYSSTWDTTNSSDSGWWNAAPIQARIKEEIEEEFEDVQFD